MIVVSNVTRILGETQSEETYKTNMNTHTPSKRNEVDTDTNGAKLLVGFRSRELRRRLTILFFGEVASPPASTPMLKEFAVSRRAVSDSTGEPLERGLLVLVEGTTDVKGSDTSSSFRRLFPTVKFSSLFGFDFRGVGGMLDVGER